MTWLILVGLILLLCFGGVLLFGAPYLPTMKPQIKAALELANLQRGDTLIELGCGDGRVVRAAARQGIKVIAYELNPLLAGLAWLRTRRYRRQVKIIWGDFWRAEWPPSQAIFTFLLPRYMRKLDKKLSTYEYKPIKLVSYAFKIPGKKIDSQQNGVFLYTY